MYKRGYDGMGKHQHLNEYDRQREDDGNHSTFHVEANDASLSSTSDEDAGSEQDWNSSASSQSSAAAAAKRSRMDYTYLASSQPHQSSRHQFSAESPVGQKNVLDDERRKIRRERNKLAAARCRQRRVDLTNTLLAETEVLENDKIKLEKEIESLYRQTNELQYVLDSHSKRCPMVFDTRMQPPTAGHTAPVDLTAVKMEKPEASPLPPKSASQGYDLGCGIGRPNSLPVGASAPKGADRQFLETQCPQLTLDFMTNGHTGLTPITGLPSTASEVPGSADCCLPSRVQNQTLMNL